MVWSKRTFWCGEPGMISQNSTTTAVIGCAHMTPLAHIQGGPKKRHKVSDTIILQPYIIESCGFQLNVPIELCKNSITLDTAIHKNVPLLFF